MAGPERWVLRIDREYGSLTDDGGNPVMARNPAGGADPYHEILHFVFNNYVSRDNRIPPYWMNYEEARRRNVLPVPAEQYGNPGPSGTYKSLGRDDTEPATQCCQGTDRDALSEYQLGIYSIS